MKDPYMTKVITTPTTDRFLRVPAITDRMGGVSRSYWWQGVKDGKFPQGVKLSARVTVWRESEIDSLIARMGKAVQA